MIITGKSIIAGISTPGFDGVTRAVDPASGNTLDPEFTLVGPEEVHAAARAAAEAFDAYRATSPEQRAAFLERIAENLAAVEGQIIQRAHSETGLPLGRLEGEHKRTIHQLRLFAQELRLGDYHGVRVDHAAGAAPDLRQRQIPLGPVAVFGASNFPLAFSTAGGDTASALAAGCPVVVKAHNSHAGTAELAGQAIAAAVADRELPAGTFSLLFGPGATIGQELAAHPAIKAIGFTGSRHAGTALMRTAACRPEPIPVYAEMSSINPVILLPGAIADDPEGLATAFTGALTLGSGQFCTNPGLLFAPAEDGRFVNAAAAALSEFAGQTMLSHGISQAYSHGLERLASAAGESIAVGTAGDTNNAPAPALFQVRSDQWRRNPEFQDEVFGAASLIVTYVDKNDLSRSLEALQGQLTITVHAASGDYEQVSALLPLLERKCGRVIFGGWPTGVEVNNAMVHGGPFPATSDSRTTSVGTLAIQRFQRPVSYQGFPEELLPDAVSDRNLWVLPRRVDGELVR